MEKVVFVKAKYDGEDPEIVAVFTNKNAVTPRGELTCYAHVGQHSTCSTEWAREQPIATPEEYAALYKELTEQIGYKLRVCKSFD